MGVSLTTQTGILHSVSTLLKHTEDNFSSLAEHRSFSRRKVHRHWNQAQATQEHYRDVVPHPRDTCGLWERLESSPEERDRSLSWWQLEYESTVRMGSQTSNLRCIRHSIPSQLKDTMPHSTRHWLLWPHLTCVQLGAPQQKDIRLSECSQDTGHWQNSAMSQG